MICEGVDVASVVASSKDDVIFAEPSRIGIGVSEGVSNGGGGGGGGGIGSVG